MKILWNIIGYLISSNIVNIFVCQDIYGLFSINAESVPCCDEALTCSRSISVKLKVSESLSVSRYFKWFMIIYKLKITVDHEKTARLLVICQPNA